jgi:Trk K+ transport system NAD-binding subunit
VVVCGLHDEGLRLVEQLHHAGVPAVVVDDRPDPRLVRSLEALGVTYLAADSRLPETLADAGLDTAVALVCVESDDLHTLATALLARELRPDLRVVVQLRNAAVGRALGDIGVRVLDVAGLAAPSIVEACLRTGHWTLDLGGQELAVVESVATTVGTLRELYGDLAPLAVVSAGGAQVEMTPGRDLGVGPGDTVVVAGPPADLAAAGLGARVVRAAPRFVSSRGPRLDDQAPANPWLRLLVASIDRRIKLAVAALFGLAALSVTVLLLGYEEPDGRRMSPLDALYFTIETIGTVGYGDFYFRDQHWWLRLWAIVLMVVGATLATGFFALLTNALVSRRIEDTFGRRRIGALEGHVVIVGAGSIGVAVATDLRGRGVPVVVVERDEDNRFLAELRAARVPVVLADATLPGVWGDLHLDRVRAVAVLTSGDLVNIETGLAVRDLLAERWAGVPVVLRIFDRRLAATVESSFDFRYVRSPASLAAPWFVGAALGLDVISTFYVGDQPLLVARLPVAPGGGLVGTAMADLPARIRVVSLARADGSVAHPPRRGTRFAAGDAAYLVGPYDELLALLRADTLSAGPA